MTASGVRGWARRTAETKPKTRLLALGQRTAVGHPARAGFRERGAIRAFQRGLPQPEAAELGQPHFNDRACRERVEDDVVPLAARCRETVDQDSVDQDVEG
jgi:hypothetical protein